MEADFLSARFHSYRVNFDTVGVVVVVVGGGGGRRRDVADKTADKDADRAISVG